MKVVQEKNEKVGFKRIALILEDVNDINRVYSIFNHPLFIRAIDTDDLNHFQLLMDYAGDKRYSFHFDLDSAVINRRINFQ